MFGTKWGVWRGAKKKGRIGGGTSERRGELRMPGVWESERLAENKRGGRVVPLQLGGGGKERGKSKKGRGQKKDLKRRQSKGKLYSLTSWREIKRKGYEKGVGERKKRGDKKENFTKKRP